MIGTSHGDKVKNDSPKKNDKPGEDESKCSLNG